MHLCDIERGNFGANAVIGGGLRRHGGGSRVQAAQQARVALAFFGDGATNIGTFHESLNLAQLWKTKTVFVCENNHWAESTPGWHSPVWDDMSKRALAYDMRSIKVDGQDVRPSSRPRTGARLRPLGRRAVFLDVETYRMHGHFIGDPQVYRSRGPREAARNDRSCDSASAWHSATTSSRRSTSSDRDSRSCTRVREQDRPGARGRAEERLCLS
jgi:pyruvate dehydrogenase E1 component alpha subunit